MKINWLLNIKSLLFPSKCHILHLLTLVFISKANYHIIAKSASCEDNRGEDTVKCDIKHLPYLCKLIVWGYSWCCCQRGIMSNYKMEAAAPVSLQCSWFLYWAYQITKYGYSALPDSVPTRGWKDLLTSVAFMLNYLTNHSMIQLIDKSFHDLVCHLIPSGLFYKNQMQKQKLHYTILIPFSQIYQQQQYLLGCASYSFIQQILAQFYFFYCPASVLLPGELKTSANLKLSIFHQSLTTKYF